MTCVACFTSESGEVCWVGVWMRRVVGGGLGVLGENPLLILRMRTDTWALGYQGSLFLILFSLRFVFQPRCALISASYVHRRPATVRNYLFVGRRNLLFSLLVSRLGISSTVFVCLCILLSSCLQCGATLSSSSLARVVTLIVFFPLRPRPLVVSCPHTNLVREG